MEKFDLRSANGLKYVKHIDRCRVHRYVRFSMFSVFDVLKVYSIAQTYPSSTLEHIENSQQTAFIEVILTFSQLHSRIMNNSTKPFVDLPFETRPLKQMEKQTVKLKKKSSERKKPLRI